RSLDRAREAEADIQSTVPGASLEILPLDLADLDSVAAFAEAFASGGTDNARGLDLLVNNAGVMALPERRGTKQGLEMQMGVNVFGHFALTARLLPHLLTAPEARTVWVSSIAHRDGRIDLDDLQSEHGYDPWTVYQQSKLADLMLALEMQRRLTDSGADAISLAAHPGVSATELTEDMMEGSPIKRGLFNTLGGLFLMPAWKGALPSLVAAASPTVQPADYVGPDGFREMRGDPKRAEIAPQAKSEETAQRLWRACEVATGLTMLS
ncbi:MAG: SDR family NAD(P)-dependent oxidoreductase, partial [Bacteroidota bacterium]